MATAILEELSTGTRCAFAMVVKTGVAVGMTLLTLASLKIIAIDAAQALIRLTLLAFLTRVEALDLTLSSHWRELVGW